MQLGHEGLAPDQPFHVAHLALDHAALQRLARGEYLGKPFFRRQMIWQVTRAGMLALCS